MKSQTKLFLNSQNIRLLCIKEDKVIDSDMEIGNS